MEDDALKMRDLVPAEPLILDPGWPWWVWALIITGALFILVPLITLVLGRKNQPFFSKSIDRSKIYRETVAEIETSAELPAQEAALRISGAIRLYLATVCRDPSLFETHEEFISRHEALKDFPEEIRNRVSSTLGRLANMKYEGPRSEEIPELGEQSLKVIELLHKEVPA